MSENEQLTTEKRKLHGELDRTQKSLEDARAEGDREKLDHQQVMEVMRSQQQQQLKLVGKLEGDVAELKSCLAAAQADRDELERQGQSLREQLGDEKDRREKLEESLQDLKLQLGDARREILERKSEMDHHCEDMARLRAELETARIGSDKLSGTLEDEKRAKREMKEQLERLQDQLEAEESKSSSLAEKLQHANQSLADFGKTLHELADRRAFFDKIAFLVKDLKYRELVLELQKEIRSIESSRDDVVARLNVVNLEHNKLKEAYHKYESYFDQHSELKFESMKNKLQDMEAKSVQEKKTLVHDLEQEKALRAEVEERLRESSAQVVEMQRRLDEIVQTTDGALRAAKEQLLKVNEEQQRLKNDSTLEAKMAEELYQDKLRCLQEETREQMQEYGSRVLLLNSQILELTAKLEEANELYEIELSRSKTLENAVKDLNLHSEEQQEVERRRAQKQGEEIASLQQELASLREKLVELEKAKFATPPHHKQHDRNNETSTADVHVEGDEREREHSSVLAVSRPVWLLTHSVSESCSLRGGGSALMPWVGAAGSSNSIGARKVEDERGREEEAASTGQLSCTSHPPPPPQLSWSAPSTLRCESCGIRDSPHLVMACGPQHGAARREDRVLSVNPAQVDGATASPGEADSDVDKEGASFVVVGDHVTLRTVNLTSMFEEEQEGHGRKMKN
eukprot:757216-Hanusia_phi.AAC.1